VRKKIKTIDEIAAACSDCGNCLHACPVYNTQWIEPNSPRGKVNLIKALTNGKLEPNPLNKKFIYHCLLCGSCRYICTNEVDFVEMMIHYRNIASKGRKIPFLKKIILFFYQSLIFKKFTGMIDLLARTPLRKKLLIPRRRPAKLKKIVSKGKDSKQHEYDILLFPGCVLTHFYPEIIEKTYRLLKKKGFSVVIPKQLECCGFPYKSQGWDRKFLSFRKKNRKLFARFTFKYLVVPCGTGVMTFKNYYDLKGVEIYELTEFFYKFIKNAAVKVNDDIESAWSKTKRLTWHDPCHHLKSLGIEEAPRFFMNRLGKNFIFIDDKSELCCGFGGIFSVGFPSTSKKILKRKQEKLNELGVDTVVTACPGCYLQLKENLTQEVKFFIDLFEN
jgi:glycolate oxidase iron-sulfur subunit